MCICYTVTEIHLAGQGVSFSRYFKWWILVINCCTMFRNVRTSLQNRFAVCPLPPRGVLASNFLIFSRLFPECFVATGLLPPPAAAACRPACRRRLPPLNQALIQQLGYQRCVSSLKISSRRRLQATLACFVPHSIRCAVQSPPGSALRPA